MFRTRVVNREEQDVTLVKLRRHTRWHIFTSVTPIASTRCHNCHVFHVTFGPALVQPWTPKAHRTFKSQHKPSNDDHDDKYDDYDGNTPMTRATLALMTMTKMMTTMMTTMMTKMMTMMTTVWWWLWWRGDREPHPTPPWLSSRPAHWHSPVPRRPFARGSSPWWWQRCVFSIDLFFLF